MALKLRAARAPAQGGVGRQSVPRQGHNTPIPLERSAPASFKRLLGSTCSTNALERGGFQNVVLGMTAVGASPVVAPIGAWGVCDDKPTAQAILCADISSDGCGRMTGSQVDDSRLLTGTTAAPLHDDKVPGKVGTATHRPSEGDVRRDRVRPNSNRRPDACAGEGVGGRIVFEAREVGRANARWASGGRGRWMCCNCLGNGRPSVR